MTEIAPTTRARARRPTRPLAVPVASDQFAIDTDAAKRRLVRLRLDLHDGPMQDLAAIGFDLGLLQRELEALPTDTSAAARQLELVKSQLVEIERTLRSVVADGEGFDLASTDELVRKEIARFARLDSARVLVDIAGDVEPATDSQRIVLQRVLREALTNVARHASATEVRVELFQDDDVVYLRVRDNGRGCDPQAAGYGRDGRSHLGLAGMRERLELLDGSLSFTSQPGGPSAVTAALKRWRPVEPSHAVRARSTSGMRRAQKNAAVEVVAFKSATRSDDK